MSSVLFLREDIDTLKKKKIEAQRRNHAEASKYRLSRREDLGLNNTEEVSEEPTEFSGEKLPSDPMDWSAAQWAKKDSPHQPQRANSGYKNLSSLAYATYAKETAKRTIDLEKYERSKVLQSETIQNHGIATNPPAPEDMDAVVKSLQEASERKQKRRTDDVSDKQYINEKNRQFNMKLEREYGKE